LKCKGNDFLWIYGLCRLKVFVPEQFSPSLSNVGFYLRTIFSLSFALRILSRNNFVLSFRYRFSYLNNISLLF
jgi:hypothetical protein